MYQKKLCIQYIYTMKLDSVFNLHKASYKKRRSRTLNKTIRKQVQISKKNHKNTLTKKKQNGGEIVSFQVYFFTQEPITNPLKLNLMVMLKELYGDDVSYCDDNITEQMIGKYLITDWVKSKGNKYNRKMEILGFSINTLPDKLKGNMDDAKLTHEEQQIASSLRKTNLPFKLTDGQPGLWSEELAIIAFENK